MLVNKFNSYYNLNKFKSSQLHGNISMKAIPAGIDTFNTTTPPIDKAIAQLGPLDRISMRKLIDKIQLQGTVIQEYPEYSIFIKSTGKDGNNLINKLSYNILTSNNTQENKNQATRQEHILGNGKIIKDTLDKWYIKPELLPSDEINLTSFVSEYNAAASTKFKTDDSFLNALNVIKQDLQAKLAEGKESKFSLGMLERIVNVFTSTSQDKHNRAISYGDKVAKYISSDFSSQITLFDLGEIISEYAEQNKDPIKAISDLQKIIARMKREFNPPNTELRG